MTRKIKLTIPEGVENHFKKWAIVHTNWDDQWNIVIQVQPVYQKIFFIEMETLNLSRWKWLRRLQIQSIQKLLNTL